MTLVSVHTFGLDSPGGGSKILRGLFRDSPIPVVSVATARTAPPPRSGDWEELHVPLRPPLSPIDGSRYNHLGHGVELALSSVYSRRLASVAHEQNADAIHAVAHLAPFWPALCAARELELPYLLSVHDDLRYLWRGAPLRGLALSRLGRAWEEADRRFVISRELGEEYCARYGRADYTIVTDGLTDEDFLEPHSGTGLELRCYFAGLFHRGYLPNFRSFLEALDLLAAREPDIQPSLRCRCGALPDPPATRVPFSVVEFGSESDVRSDMSRADLLYLPLMFGAEYRDMTAFSLSTKLITYLGSGVPILYHGPAETAAGRLLAEHDAAILATSEDPVQVAETIAREMPRASELVANARALAEREFMLADQRARFWDAVVARPTALV